MPCAVVQRKRRLLQELFPAQSSCDVVLRLAGDSHLQLIQHSEHTAGSTGRSLHMEAQLCDAIAAGVGNTELDLQLFAFLQPVHFTVKTLLADSRQHVGTDIHFTGQVEVRYHGSGEDLAGVDRGREDGLITLIIKIVTAVEGLVVHIAVVSGQDAVQNQLHATFHRVLSKTQGVAQAQAMGRTGQREVEQLLTALGQLHRCILFHAMGQTVQLVQELAVSGHIQVVHCAGDTGKHNEVVHGITVMRRNALQTTEHAQNGADVAGIAVGIPTAHSSDLDGAAEIACAIQHTQHANTGIGNDMAHTGVLIIAPVVDEELHASLPIVGIFLVECAHSVDHSCIGAIGGNVLHTHIDDLVNGLGLVSSSDTSSQESSAVNAVAIVRHAGSCHSHLGSHGRITQVDQAPGVDEDLATDLLSQNDAILLNRTGLRCGDALLQVVVSGVLGGDAVAAPPIQTDAISGVVEPCLTHSLGSQLVADAVVQQAAQEIHGTIDIVISRKILVVTDVAADIAAELLDPLKIPGAGLHGCTQANTCVHAQKAGIDPFQHLIHKNLALLDQRSQILSQATDGQTLGELQASAAGIAGTLDPSFGDLGSTQLCATDSAQNCTNSVSVTAEVSSQDDAALEAALAQQEQSECLRNSLLDSSLVTGTEVIMQSHPSLAEVSLSQLHQLQHVLHVVVQPAIGGDAGHSSLDDLFVGAGHHCGSNSSCNSLCCPDTAVVVADFSVTLSQFLSMLYVTCADNANGRNTHASAIGEAVNRTTAGLRGHNAALQVLSSVDLGIAATGELVLTGDVLQPAFSQVLVRRIALVVDQHLSSEDCELGIVGGPDLAAVKRQDHAIVLMIFGDTAGVAKAIADGQTCHCAQCLLISQFGIVDQIVSGKHCLFLRNYFSALLLVRDWLSSQS